ALLHLAAHDRIEEKAQRSLIEYAHMHELVGRGIPTHILHIRHAHDDEVARDPDKLSGDEVQVEDVLEDVCGNDDLKPVVREGNVFSRSLPDLQTALRRYLEIFTRDVNATTPAPRKLLQKVP